MDCIMVLINVPRLMNVVIVEAHEGGKVEYEDRGDKGLIDLLTKCFIPKKRYSSKIVQIFNNLNMLSGIPEHTSSGKLKLIGGMVYYTTPEDLMK